MQISVSVQLDENETLAYTPDAAAMQVLVALGGNQTNDYCQLYLVVPPGHPGEAGVPPEPLT